VLGWNPAKQNGLFIGGNNAFVDTDTGKQLGNSLMDQGADIILPVAGKSGLGTMAAIQERGPNFHGIWVDTDGCVNAPQFCDFFITSVEKRIAVAVSTAVTAAFKGSFQGGTGFLGTLQNTGTDISPFHMFDSQVPQTLKDELTMIKQGIIDGTISVKPQDYPAA
jgi:basic membrane protein A